MAMSVHYKMSEPPIERFFGDIKMYKQNTYRMIRITDHLQEINDAINKIKGITGFSAKAFIAPAHADPLS